MAINAKQPSWTNVKNILITREPPELLMLIKDLYGLNKNNKTFIEARYQVSKDVLEPYKKIISDALYPDITKNKSISLSAGRKSIRDYKKAVNDPAGSSWRFWTNITHPLKCWAIPKAHGEHAGNSLTEIHYFSHRWLTRLFRETGWTVMAQDSNRLFYTGVSIMVSRLTISTRNKLSRV